MAFSPDSKYLLTRGVPPGDDIRGPNRVAQVFVWELDKREQVAQFLGGAAAVAFSPDGKTLAVSESTGRIALRDTTKWAVTGTFRDSHGRATALAFGPDARLYSGYADATVLAWDPRGCEAPGRTEVTVSRAFFGPTCPAGRSAGAQVVSPSRCSRSHGKRSLGGAGVDVGGAGVVFAGDQGGECGRGCSGGSAASSASRRAGTEGPVPTLFRNNRGNFPGGSRNCLVL